MFFVSKVLGMLKVGMKRLFVYDRHSQQWEMEPLCVLDFYVHESHQRMGYGKKLFAFMLKVNVLLIVYNCIVFMALIMATSFKIISLIVEM